MLRILLISTLSCLSLQAVSQDYVRSGLDYKSVKPHKIYQPPSDTITMIIIDGLEYDGALTDIPIEEIETYVTIRDLLSKGLFCGRDYRLLLVITLKHSKTPTEERFLDWQGIGQAIQPTQLHHNRHL